MLAAERSEESGSPREKPPPPAPPSLVFPYPAAGANSKGEREGAEFFGWNQKENLSLLSLSLELQ